VFDSTLSIFKINSYLTLSDLALLSKDRPKLQFGARQPIISKCWALAPSQRWLVASRGPSAKTHHDGLSTIRVISRCHTPSSPNLVLVRWKLWPCTTNTFQDSLSYIRLGYKHWLASFSSNVYMLRMTARSSITRWIHDDNNNYFSRYYIWMPQWFQFQTTLNVVLAGTDLWKVSSSCIKPERHTH